MGELHFIVVSFVSPVSPIVPERQPSVSSLSYSNSSERGLPSLHSLSLVCTVQTAGFYFLFKRLQLQRAVVSTARTLPRIVQGDSTCL